MIHTLPWFTLPPLHTSFHYVYYCNFLHLLSIIVINMLLYLSRSAILCSKRGLITLDFSKLWRRKGDSGPFHAGRFGLEACGGGSWDRMSLQFKQQMHQHANNVIKRHKSNASTCQRQQNTHSVHCSGLNNSSKTEERFWFTFCHSATDTLCWHCLSRSPHQLCRILYDVKQ